MDPLDSCGPFSGAWPAPSSRGAWPGMQL